MAKQYPSIPQRWAQFIAEQKIFFVATATADSRVNVSPKGLESLCILDPNRVAWLNLTGSGNESAAHVQTDPRMTLMFCAFTGDPVILRLYGTARAVHHSDQEWGMLSALFPSLPGARQIFDVAIDLVQTSCGFGVPYFDFVGDRPDLRAWTEKKGEDGVRRYWQERNAISIDGIETGIDQKNRT
ncbi:MAG: pyridoxamine 5'-phosphate oxidase family protein [Acidiferrobacter sp.]